MSDQNDSRARVEKAGGDDQNDCVNSFYDGRVTSNTKTPSASKFDDVYMVCSSTDLKNIFRISCERST
jgi:hypothetical protein